MQVSEYSFSWLYREREERLTRELEWRRRELERAGEDGRPRRAKWFARRHAAASRRGPASPALRQAETAGCGGQVAR